MKNAIRHIAIYLLTTIVVVASTGFSVCCMFGCHDDEVNNGEIECCEKKIAELPPEQQKNGCPDCVTEYVSLDIDYLVSSYDFKLNIDQVAVLPTVLFSYKNHISTKSIAPLEHDLPPPPYGKDLLPIIQTFLC